MCMCCGKLVVLLRIPGQEPKRRLCYVKGWDGSPFYSNGSAHPHPRKWLARAFEKLRGPAVETDPFFSL